MFRRKGKRKKSPTIDRPQLPESLWPDRVLEQYREQSISTEMEPTIEWLGNLLGQNEDFVVRRFHIFGQYSAAIIYFTHLADMAGINNDLLKPLMILPRHLEGREINIQRLQDIVINEMLFHTQIRLETNLVALVEAILAGETVILIDGIDQMIIVNTVEIETRSITQPQTEQVIRGPRDGFVEQLGTNIALMRYRLQTPSFRVKTIMVGKLTKSKVAVCYIEGIANPALIEEVEKRLQAIDIDGILDSGYLEQCMQDNHLSPFPQMQNTERPDKAVANLLEGRVIILMNGSPFALIAPSVFSQFYQTAEDYNERFLLVSFVRLSRLVALVFSLIFPSLYVAVISFNPELIPTEFAVAVAGGRAGVPFPTVIEVLLMEISMEVLREATIRLPQQVGGALSIVGVLVVGQAAVAAGFANPITVVIIALTTIGSFATPAYNAALALRLLRFPLVILAGMFGLYGVTVGLLLIINHMLSLKSFGVPYLTPVVPGNFQGMKDTLIRGPLWWMRQRPTMLQPYNQNRMGKQMQNVALSPPNNALDPLKANQDRKGTTDGKNTNDNRTSSRSDSD